MVVAPIAPRRKPLLQVQGTRLVGDPARNNAESFSKERGLYD
jgi:hypothetical protein